MQYFAVIDGEQVGPMPLDELCALDIRPDTLVWCKVMTEWRPAKDVGEVCRYFRRHLDELMHPQAELPVATPEKTLEEMERSILAGAYRYMVQRAGEEPRPQPAQEPLPEVAPKTWIPEAIITALLCFPFTGFIALWFGMRSRIEWKAGRKAEAADASRRAKMLVGITFFMGMIFYALAAHYLN